ncbi:MAG: hypothetical protein WC648_04945 [Candidatus Paceibacterota bacterium]|jgi:hypothetical protein
MVWDKLNFNCGEFFPGKEPIRLGDIVKPPVPPIYIPIHTSAPVVPPYVPGRPQEWVCVCDSPCDSSVGFPSNGRYLCTDPNSRRCVEKWTIPITRPQTLVPYTSKAACETDAYNHAPCLICGIKCNTDSNVPCILPYVGREVRRHCVECPPAAIQPPECFYRSMHQCIVSCHNEDCVRPTGPVGPKNPTTPGGSTQPTPVTPVTTRTRYKCGEITLYCPGDENLPIPQRRIKQIIRNCSLCTPNANGTWPTDCIYLTLNECSLVCHSSEIDNCVTQTPILNTRPSPLEGPITPVGTPPTQREEPTEPSTLPPNRNITVINIGVEANANQISYNETPSTNSQIYHSTYNFFNNNLNSTGIRIGTEVRNFNNLNIFQTNVMSEVAYFLNRNRSRGSWNEDPLFNLTTESIKKSLIPNLVEAFEKIHNIGGQYVNPEYFYKSVLRLLVTGRINELDPAHYISIAQKQSNDNFIKFEGTTVKEYLERASLGFISKGGINSDPEMSSGYSKNRLKRQRRLNTDIEAFIETIELETPTLVEELNITDAGLEVVELGASSSLYLDLGDGAGYYISSLVIESGEEALRLNTQVSTTIYVPPDVRYNALDILNVQPGIVLQVSSVSGYGEFSQNYSYENVSGPLYFKLELSSIETGTRDNPLVDIINAQYTLLTDVEGEASVINQHALNYGFAISKVNVDYRDPFYNYARDTGLIDFTQNDITFRSFSLNRTSVGQTILARNIPFALIVTPGCGSVHNPLTGESELIEFESDIVVRKLTLVPDINTSDGQINYPLLEERILFNETHGYKVGLAETNDAQNVLYLYSPSASIFDKSYFIDGVYDNDPPESIERHPLSKFIVSTLDQIIITYDPLELTWWDIIRRVTLNDYAAIGYTPKSLFNRIEAGWRSSIPVRNVLSRLDKTYTGIGGADSDDSNIIISESDRINKIY